MLGHIHVDSIDWTLIHNCIQQRLDTYMWTVMIGKQPSNRPLGSLLYFVSESHLQNTFVVALHITSVSVD